MSVEQIEKTDIEAFSRTCRQLVRWIVAGEVASEDLESAKLDACGKFGSPKVPTNPEILDHASAADIDVVEEVVRRKPVRTASGVSPIAIMTSPAMCPHGKCLYCPGGPASEFSSSQSYTGHEPAAARGVQTAYDPYAQVMLRLSQLRRIGHPVDKAELILMGGTMTARSHDYQEWFVKRALEAMNDFDPTNRGPIGDPNKFRQEPGSYPYRYLEDVKAENERSHVRNIATTFETKPDWCDPEQIDRMLDLGGTKVEIGVQTTYDEINRAMHRGHGTQDSIDANRRLRDAGFKVGFHMMPGQPGMTDAMNREDFRRLFEDPVWRPDYLKIYPTLVVRDTRVYDMWHQGDYDPLNNDEAASLIADIKSMLPPYVRLQRVQRDIPADFIDGGVWKSNLRQLAQEQLHERGESCACIRCREVGHHDITPDEINLETTSYKVAKGEERFISVEDHEQDVLIGFCRLRFPGSPVRRELQNAALIRELHVYGESASIGEASDAWQHQGIGKQLMAEAEAQAQAAGYEKISVISGIGARPYYREHLDYYQDGPYVSKLLSA